MGNVQNSLTIFDADTGRELTDVKELTMHLSATHNAEADMVQRTHSTRVDVVPRPKHPLAGKQAALFTMTREKDLAMCCEVFEGTGTVHEIGDDGQLASIATETCQQRRTIDDHTLKTAKDVKTVVELTTKDVLYGVVSAVVKYILGAVAPPMGGVVLPKSAPVRKFASVDLGRDVVVNEPNGAMGFQGRLISINGGTVEVQEAPLQPGWAGVCWRGEAQYVEFVKPGKAVVDARACPECHGTGKYRSQVTGDESPCSICCPEETP